MATAPDQTMPTDERREALRARLLGETPRWYRPWVHLLAPTLFGLTVVVIAAAHLHHVGALELLTVPITWLASNAVEWRAHKYVLHKRRWFAPVIYDKHTPEHHMLYVTDDMSIRDPREFRLVLIPAYGIGLILLGVLPGIWGFWHRGGDAWHDVACLFAITCMFYTVSYEWFHLSYHLPPDSFIGRRKLIRVLRRHHAMHHDPRLMQKWNFNVNVPLWDWVRGTIYREPAVEPARAAETART